MNPTTTISKEDLIQALKSLPADQIAGIWADQQHGRSPIRARQLDDLRLKPSATDPRPTWFAETDGREFQPILQRAYPKLLWHRESGQEITVHSEREEKSRGLMWLATAPETTPLTPEELAHQLFESLNDADKAFIHEHQRQMRLETVKQALSALNESQIAAVLATANGKK